jgi:hypothetical protein
MPRGSRPGERRGGRQRGTPNKKTLIKNAVFLATAADPNRSPLEFMLAPMRDPQVPLHLRIDVAAAAARLVHARPKASGRTRPHPMEIRARRRRLVDPSAGAPAFSSPPREPVSPVPGEADLSSRAENGIGSTAETGTSLTTAGTPSSGGREDPLNFLLAVMHDPEAAPRHRVDIAASAHLRDAMLGELNAIGSEDAATKWAQRRLAEKNKLNATDAKHVEEAFRAKLLSFAIHHSEGVPESKSDAAGSSTTDRARRKARTEMPSAPVDKSVLLHPEPRRIRDREHVRFVSQQTCLVCGRRPCDAHHLRYAQNRALGRKVSDEFTVPLCRGHHREVHRHGDEAAWWQQLGLNPAGAARSLWLETHPVPVEDSPADDVATATSHATRVAPER